MATQPQAAIRGLNGRYKCRRDQVQQLAHLLAPGVPSPASIVVHGLPATGKSIIVGSVLKEVATPHVVIACAESITGRHLLERIASLCLALAKSLGLVADEQSFAGCDSVNALSAHLQSLLPAFEKVVLALDGIDERRDAPSALLQALARLGEIIPGLTVIFIVTTPSSRLLHVSGVPHVYFPSYSGSELVTILDTEPSPLDEKGSEEIPVELRNSPLYKDFLKALHSSLSGGISDIIAFRSLSTKLWHRFVAPVKNETIPKNDFAKLMIANRTLFQSEEPLLERLAPTPLEQQDPRHATTYDLPYYSKFLLCAAYLASYNPARTDSTFFMRYTEKKRRRRAHGAALGRPPRNRRIPRRLLAPSAFILERMMAIFHSIVPHPVVPTADLYTQIATLLSLRLLVKSGLGSGDGLDSASRLKANITEDFIVSLARSVNFEIGEMFAEV